MRKWIASIFILVALCGSAQAVTYNVAGSAGKIEQEGTSSTWTSITINNSNLTSATYQAGRYTVYTTPADPSTDNIMHIYTDEITGYTNRDGVHELSHRPTSDSSDDIWVLTWKIFSDVTAWSSLPFNFSIPDSPAGEYTIYPGGYGSGGRHYVRILEGDQAYRLAQDMTYSGIFLTGGSVITQQGLYNIKRASDPITQTVPHRSPDNPQLYVLDTSNYSKEDPADFELLGTLTERSNQNLTTYSQLLDFPGPKNTFYDKGYHDHTPYFVVCTYRDVEKQISYTPYVTTQLSYTQPTHVRGQGGITYV